MIYPYKGVYSVTTPFGVVNTAYSRYPGSKHPGVDFNLSAGTPLRAAMSGTVRVFRSTAKTGRGNEVWITEGTLSARCCHMQAISVVDGQRIAEGQPIGTSGYTGYVVDRYGNVGTPAGAHLHFEVVVDGQYVNPLKVLGTEGEEVSKPTYDEVLQAFRDFTGTDCTEAQQNYYVARDASVLYKDLAIFQRDRLREARAALAKSNAPDEDAEKWRKLAQLLGIKE
jgi:hypothetical protein